MTSLSLSRRKPANGPSFDLLLGFVPFVIFSVLTRLSVDLALWAAFASAFAIGLRGFLETRLLRMLDAGSAAVFGLLALFGGFLEPGLDLAAMRLIVDASLLAIAIASLVAKEPLTLHYAEGTVEDSIRRSQRFVRANSLVTAVWAAAFALMALADGAATFDPRIPLTLAVGAGMVSLASALFFTWRYPARVVARVARRPGR